MEDRNDRPRDRGKLIPHPDTSEAGSLEALVFRYMTHLKGERGLAKTTTDGYGSHIRKYVRYLQETGTPVPVPEDFCRGTVRAFMQTVHSRGLRPRSVRYQIVSLKMFGKWAAAEAVIPSDPTEGMAYPKLDAPTRDTVTDAEVVALLDACERLGDPERVALARAVVSALCYAALRRSELLDLKMADVSLAERSITVVHGKGAKTRVVYPHPECFAAIRAWLLVRPKDCQHPYVFSLNRRHRLWDGGLTTLFRDLKAIAGLKDNPRIHPHAMRRGCATRLLNQGYTIFDVQGFLGHADMKTTQIYIAPDEQRLKGLADKGGLGNEPDAPKQGTTSNSAPSLLSWKDHARRPTRRATGHD